MRDCSHSRNSYPFDKSLPKIHRIKDESDKRKRRSYDCRLSNYTPAQKKVESNMHKKKQRAYNKVLARQQLDEMGE
jgi:hypothetical protein